MHNSKKWIIRDIAVNTNNRRQGRSDFLRLNCKTILSAVWRFRATLRPDIRVGQV